MLETLRYQDQELDYIGITPKELINALTLDDVVNFLRSLGVNQLEINSERGYIICPTICHNPLNEEASMKLYWYQNYKLFHCYTECNENMSIFQLYQKVMEINYSPVTLEEALIYVRQCLTHEITQAPQKNKRNIIDYEKYKYDTFIPELPEYNKCMLSYFTHYYHPTWLRDGITPAVMDKFNIGFSISQNKIVIPHFDIKDRLIGIRARTINPEEIEATKMKYGPIKIADTLYSHAIHFNLYGINLHKQAIAQRRIALIVEAEKSVMLDDVYENDNSIAIACCGLSFNKYQVSLLTDILGANEIIIGFDKEYETWNSLQARQFKQTIIKQCNKYKHKASFSYIWDYDNVLKEKDSPLDRGQDVFNHLYKTRVKVV